MNKKIVRCVLLAVLYASLVYIVFLPASAALAEVKVPGLCSAFPQYPYSTDGSRVILFELGSGNRRHILIPGKLLDAEYFNPLYRKGTTVYDG